MSAQPRLCFVSASEQNAFFEELLVALRETVEGAGLRTMAAVDHFPAAEVDLVYVFVPHEYLPLTLPSAHPTTSQLSRTVAICTEQPGTHWFEEAVDVAGRCGAAIDINSLGAEALRKRGVNALLLPLGYVSSWDYWHGRDTERPIDVTFMGGFTPRRAASIACCGAVLISKRCAFHLYDTSRPHTRNSDQFFSGEQKWNHLASSKLLLNIHRSELGYLEWQRVIGAMANGCVVVTEHSLGIEPLEPGTHFVSSKLEDFPFIIDSLLADPDRLAAIRMSAYSLLRDQFRLSSSIKILTDAASAVLDSAAPPERTAGTVPHPAPKAPPAPMTEYEREVEERRNEQRLLRMAVKRILLEQRELQRALARLEASAHEAPASEVELERFGPFERVRPRVSVLVSVYNYRDHVEEALRSASLSSLREIEVIVVDDASTDDSAQVVTKTLETMPWLASLFLRRRHNAGLPRARNLGAAHARGEYVFILDADNAVYPHAFERLLGALESRRDAAFAYGMLEERIGGKAAGLLSWSGWDARRLRYGNFVDAMAMIRRDALLEVGGFPTDPRLFGWEDFGLWCAFAQHGWVGTQVPELLGHYRVIGHSMIALTNIDASEAWTALARRFPFLMSGPDEPVLPRVTPGHDLP